MTLESGAHFYSICPITYSIFFDIDELGLTIIRQNNVFSHWNWQQRKLPPVLKDPILCINTRLEFFVELKLKMGH